MITELYELYKLYQIYRKLNQIKYIKDVTTEYCQEIKEMVLSGGCIYIKFAQWVISRLRSEKGKNIEFVVDFFDDIFDQCPTHSLVHAMDTFKEATKISMDSYINLDTLETIASGSIGQVYKAELINPVLFCNKCNVTSFVTTCITCASPTKQVNTVAIKIKHPEIDRQITNKVKLFSLLNRMQKVKWLKDNLCLHMDFMEFITSLTAQADFRNEQRNCMQFRRNFAGNPLVYFPYILMGTSNVLVTEYVSGQTLEDLSEYNQLKCCYNYACMVIQMLAVDNFCHGDLHHGNWKVRTLDLDIGGQSINDCQLIIYDYGICFSGTEKRVSQTIIEAFDNNDASALVEVITEVIEGEYDNNVLDLVKDLIHHYRSKELDLMVLFNSINNLLIKYNCKLTSGGMNTVLLLSLIDTTLRKHNLIGGNVSPDQMPRTTPSSIIRAKNLDLIAYAKSRRTYEGFIEYMQAKHQRQRSSLQEDTLTPMGIFSACSNNTLQLDDPE